GEVSPNVRDEGPRRTKSVQAFRRPGPRSSWVSHVRETTVIAVSGMVREERARAPARAAATASKSFRGRARPLGSRAERKPRPSGEARLRLGFAPTKRLARAGRRGSCGG